MELWFYSLHQFYLKPVAVKMTSINERTVWQAGPRSSVRSRATVTLAPSVGQQRVHYPVSCCVDGSVEEVWNPQDERKQFAHIIYPIRVWQRATVVPWRTETQNTIPLTSLRFCSKHPWTAQQSNSDCRYEVHCGNVNSGNRVFIYLLYELA